MLRTLVHFQYKRLSMLSTSMTVSANKRCPKSPADKSFHRLTECNLDEEIEAGRTMEKWVVKI